MSSKIISVFLYLIFISVSVCEIISPGFSYDEELKKILNMEEITRKIMESTEGIDIYARLQMLDAMTKIPSGIFAGNFFDLGNYDECYGIKSGSIYGKYCLGTISITNLIPHTLTRIFENATKTRIQHFRLHPEPRLIGLGVEYMGMHFAICVPHTLKVENISGIIKFTKDMCSSKATEPTLSAGVITTIVILSIFAALIIASTIFDIYLYYTDRKSPHELFIAFSFLTNGRKIFSTTTNSDQLLCLNGIKAISMMWVILGHEYSQAMDAPLSNVGDIGSWQKDPANMFINGATVSVDTFFVVGGLVTVYTFLKSMDKGVKFNLALYYIHRYLRLTPALAILSLVHLFLLNFFRDGPLWMVVDTTLVQTCETGWWSTLLYITNYVQKGTCLPQTWYLAVDMQLFILSPIILIPLFKWPKIGLGMLGFLTLAGVLVPFSVVYSENLGGLFTDARTNPVYYIQTYTRFGPYVIGIITGYFIYKVRKSGLKLHLSSIQMVVIIGTLWLVCLTGLVACVYAGFDLSISTDPDMWGNALFMAFNRNAWAVALCILIFLCTTGYGGPVDSFLSWSVFQFLTKLSYSMYLVHVTVITVRYAIMRSTYRFNNYNTVSCFEISTMFLAIPPHTPSLRPHASPRVMYSVLSTTARNKTKYLDKGNLRSLVILLLITKRSRIKYEQAYGCLSRAMRKKK